MTTDPADEGLALVQKLMQDLGYRASIEEDRIVGSASGMKLAIVLYPGSLQIAGGISDVPPAFGLEDVNAFNGRFRFGTVYRAEDSLLLQASFLLDPASADAKDIVEKVLSIFEGLASELRSAVSAKLEDDPATDGDVEGEPA